MLFSSITFLFYFFPAVLLTYYVCSFSRQIQNLVLLAASLFFYAWGEPINVLIMIASIAFNTFFGYAVTVKNVHIKKAALIADIILNLGILIYFKYLGFILEQFVPVIGKNQFNIALPIGISFFTFQALSYVVDVYKGIVIPADPLKVGLYISFFPQLIAGPIIQYKSVAEQIKTRKTSLNKLSLGITRFCEGFVKKVLLANCFAAIADNVFGWSAIGVEKFQVPMMLAWLGSIAYSLQIYFDFSAYSDMAIGLGLCFGFKFDENFNYPYTAKSITDFWRRWHISLTNWFREYIYIPLGGNRVANRDIMVRNMFVVWLLTGIWHGANWTFIIWGMYYFLLQLAERFFGYPDKIKNSQWSRVYTLFLVNIGWVLFRADNLYQAGQYIANMFGLNHNGMMSQMAWMLIRENWVFLIAGIVFSTPVVRNINKFIYDNPKDKTSIALATTYPLVLMILMVVAVGSLASGSYNPFIYFNF